MAANVVPARLMFEITETVAMKNADKTTATIRKFQSLGFEMAIDDFGNRLFESRLTCNGFRSSRSKWIASSSANWMITANRGLRSFRQS